MLDMRVEKYLVKHLCLFEYIFCLAALLSGEDFIGFCLTNLSTQANSDENIDVIFYLLQQCSRDAIHPVLRPHQRNLGAQ